MVIMVSLILADNPSLAYKSCSQERDLAALHQTESRFGPYLVYLLFKKYHKKLHLVNILFVIF